MLDCHSMGRYPTSVELDVDDILYPEKAKMFAQAYRDQLKRVFTPSGFSFQIGHPFDNIEGENLEVYFVFDEATPKAAIDYVINTQLPEDWDDIALRFINNKMAQAIRNFENETE